MKQPLVVDLFAGLGGWSEGFIEAGYRVIGFDIERHQYGEAKYPGELVLQDVLTLHGSQFKEAAVIVASPPCQNYSYLAMPWSRSKSEHSQKAKALRKKWETEGPDNRLFDACFRIQREAIEASCHCECPRCSSSGHCIRCDCHRNTGKSARHIPLIVENVRGAVPWVGREAASFGSFYLWGDVACVGNRLFAGRDLEDIRAGRGRFGMGVAPFDAAIKQPGNNSAVLWRDRPVPRFNDGESMHKVPGFRFDGSGRSFQTASVNKA